MCGICGCVSLSGQPVDPAPVRAMLRRMIHRGPDAEGTFESAGIAAGIRRLAVIDVHGGDQPISNEDGQVSVVFNGEIYGFGELRRSLESRGHRFRTRADTEVLVHLWEERGPEMVHELNGMFAFAVHDRRTRETFIARDRFGIKPLFYHLAGDRLVFASETSVLLAHGAVPGDVDHDALIELYCLQLTSGEGTIYREVKKLLPGHSLHVRSGKARVARWYELPRREERARQMDEAPATALRRLLSDAVRLRTVADVPLGMFLSGGIDSSIIALELARASSLPVKTFSVGFEGAPAFDERQHARLVAERIGSEHHELLVSPIDIASHLPRLVEHLAEPVVDPALIPTYLLSEFARREVTVVLTGEGADELFGGYRRYSYQRRFGWLGRLPGFGLLARDGTLRRLPGRWGQAVGALAERDPVRNHLAWAAIVSRATAHDLFRQDAYQRVVERAADSYGGPIRNARTRLGGQLAADLCEWLPHNLLAKVDRATMAFSLEARVPFLDHRVVELATALPDEMKIDGGSTKVVLREAYGPELPEGIARRPKRGFDLPLAAWIRGPLRVLAADTVTPQALGRWPVVDPAAAASMLHEHLSGRRDHGLPLFNLLSILLFLETRG